MAGSQHAKIAVNLPPLVQNLHALADHVVKLRNDPSSKSRVLRILSWTGGHPRLLSLMLPWVSDLSTGLDSITLENVVSKYSPDEPLLSNKDVIDAIMMGKRISLELASEATGIEGILSRPGGGLQQPGILIASPIIVYLVLEPLGICRTDLCFASLATGDTFKRFVAAWLPMRIRRGDSLRTLLDSTFTNGGNAALTDQLGLPINVSGKGGFIKRGKFLTYLPIVSANVFVGTEDGSISFGFTEFSKERIVKVANPTNEGFDLLIGCAEAKRVLFIQCNAQEANNAQSGGVGASLPNDALLRAAKYTLKQGKWFFENGWTASLVILSARSNLSPNVLSSFEEEIGEDQQNELRLRSAVFDRGMLRDLFGASFALMLELSQGLVGNIEPPENFSHEEA